VVGSIGFLATAALTLANDTYWHETLLGSDDSTLTEGDYRATWWLMSFSGAFCILGRCVCCVCAVCVLCVSAYAVCV
jgi:hypothetical protein